MRHHRLMCQEEKALQHWWTAMQFQWSWLSFCYALSQAHSGWIQSLLHSKILRPWFSRDLCWLNLLLRVTLEICILPCNNSISCINIAFQIYCYNDALLNKWKNYESTKTWTHCSLLAYIAIWIESSQKLKMPANLRKHWKEEKDNLESKSFHSLH